MAKKETEIRVRVGMYPNGGIFYKVMLGDEHVGSFDKKDSGYTPFNCRKGFALMQDAAREVVWKRVQRALRDGAQFSAAMKLPVNVDSVYATDGEARASGERMMAKHRKALERLAKS